MLRDYQRQLAKDILSALDKPGARVMVQLPTGGGKTEVAAAVLMKWLADDTRARAVWLTHRQQLCEQTEARLRNWGIRAASVTDGWRTGTPAPSLPGGVAILKAQTVGRRNRAFHDVWARYGPDDILVIDEAHHATAPGWARAIDQWPGKTIGLTATPWRLSKTDGFDHLFDVLIEGPQVVDLQNAGFLARSKVFTPPPEDRIIGGVVGRDGDYTERGIERTNRREVMTTKAVWYWRKMARQCQTVVYAVSTGHARNLALVFAHDGVAAKTILSNTPDDERASTIANFKASKIQVLINVSVATEGYDLPDADCVMITRPTQSLALYLQMVGRGLRPKVGGGSCLVLDLAANAEVHGLPDTPRSWSLMPRGEPQAGAPLAVRCHECGFMAHPSLHRCPECGTDMGKPCPRCQKFRSWANWHTSLACAYCSDDLQVAIALGEDINFGDAPSVPNPEPTHTAFDQDRASLTALYRATGGGEWIEQGAWLTDSPLSEWHGVTIDDNGRVATLDLSHNGLKGQIPDALGELNRLTVLDLGGNSLTGRFPTSLSNLKHVEWLDLSHNSLTGRLPPSLGELRRLRWLRLNDNQLNGPIPQTLGYLTKLMVLRLSGNQLSGEIPWSLARITNLAVLDLGGNLLNGEMPYEMGRLKSLQELILSNNNLTGEIPAELSRLVNISDLYLGGNAFSGGIPSRLRDADRHDLNTLSLPFVN